MLVRTLEELQDVLRLEMAQVQEYQQEMMNKQRVPEIVVLPDKRV